ncbi:MAG: porin [Verrucomicrobiota bacterium]
MQTARSTTRRWPRSIRAAAWCACLGLLTLSAFAQEQTNAAPAKTAAPKVEEPVDPGELRNLIEWSFGGNFVDGDPAQFRRRMQMQRGAYGGIEQFHWEQDVGKRGLLKLDGHALFDAHDYSFKFDLSEPDKGFLRFGYSEYRTWYDGSGGFFPRNAQSFPLYNDSLSLDRGEVFIEGGLRRPDWPEITLSYRHIFRDGQKDSTIWGDTTLTTVPGANSARGIVPSFLDINERREIFSADIKQNFGKTDAGLGFRYELTDSNNSRNLRRSPGQAADRHLTQRDQMDADMFNIHGFTETRFNDEWLFTTGYSYTLLESDVAGSRIYGDGYDPMYDPLFARRQARDEGFINLTGGSRMDQYVVNFNVMWTPFDNFTVVPSVRIERQFLNSASHYFESTVGTGAGLPTTLAELTARSERGLLEIAESLELRYTGLTNWVLYARGHWMQGEGDQTETENQVTTGVNDLLRDTDFDRSTQKYTLGANWYPRRNLNFGLQYYHKLRTEDYLHRDDTTANRSGNRYPAFLVAQDFTTDDMNLRVTWRPLGNLTLVSRYDFQLSTIEMQGDSLNKIESAEMTSHIFSQSVSWTPLARLYTQASINYVLDRTDSPASSALSGTVLDSRNNYWNMSVTVGYALSKKTDVEATYTYYRADNYVDNSALSQPYGAGAEEHGVSVGLVRRFSERLRGKLRYGFFRSRDDTSGGINNFDAHMIYSSMTYLF